MSQSKTVLKHLTSNRKITSIEAIGLYGITRLSAVVHSLNKQGYQVNATMKNGVKSSYAEYSLAK